LHIIRDNYGEGNFQQLSINTYPSAKCLNHANNWQVENARIMKWYNRRVFAQCAQLLSY